MTLALQGLPALDRNGWLVLAGKALRSFAFGLNAVALGLYLAAAGLPEGQIGVVLSGALLGTLGLTLVIALWGDRIGRRRLLIAGGLLMMLAALIPIAGANMALLALLGLSGMVAVTANESSGLQSVDQAILPETAPTGQRTRAFALYNVVAVGASALGSLVVGLLPIVGGLVGLSGAAAYNPSFLLYAATGLAVAAFASLLDPRVEVGTRVERSLAIHRSRPIVARLSVLYGLDSLAGSFVVQSFLAYWFATRFAAQPALLGALFFAAGLLAALSFPVAAWLAARIGLVRTMVFTHIPASLFLIAMAFAPTLSVATALFLARSALSSMDVPARQSYTMAIVDRDERTATAGLTGFARSVAQVPGPGLAGVLLVPLGLGIPIVATGVLKIAYDLALFALFRSHPAPEETSLLVIRSPDPVGDASVKCEPPRHLPARLRGRLRRGDG